MPAPIAVAAIAAAVILCVAAAGHYAYRQWIRPIYSTDQLVESRGQHINGISFEQENTSSKARTPVAEKRLSVDTEHRPLLLAGPSTSVDFGGFFRGRFNPGTLINPIVRRMQRFLRRRTQRPQSSTSNIPRKRHNTNEHFGENNTQQLSPLSSLLTGPSASTSVATSSSVISFGEEAFLATHEDILGMELALMLSMEEENSCREQAIQRESDRLKALEQELEDRRQVIGQSLLIESLPENIQDKRNNNLSASSDAELEAAYNFIFMKSEKQEASTEANVSENTIAMSSGQAPDASRELLWDNDSLSSESSIFEELNLLNEFTDIPKDNQDMNASPADV
ncbi:hypothetical protein BDF19DRAFT_434355 [Syncephalis fuscata]|nr:hypothetical protein BDF19DRAFT_434355 [Syncephalis fuscata]